MGAGTPDGLEARRILARLAEALPSASPVAQAVLLVLAEQGEARMATLAKALDLPQALVLRAATELAELCDQTDPDGAANAPLALLIPGRSPGAGVIQLTEAGTRLARRAIGQPDPDGQTEPRTGRRDH